MCGIVGYVGPQQAEGVVIEGLRRLEYRGYDSAGIALVHDGKIACEKRAGKLANLDKALADHPLPEACTGIGHTRWATHGAPNDRNAHPHLGAGGRVALVHNGIIENFAALRAEIETAGHELLSETDTEIAAHLVEAELQEGGTLTEAMQNVCRRLHSDFFDFSVYVDWDLSAAEKGGFDWFMRKEIHEQPRSITDTMLGRHDEDGALQLDELRIAEDELRSVDKIIIVACGTASYAGMVAKYAIEHWTRIPCEVELSHEFRYRDPILTRDTLVVAVSQSGETADTLMAIRHARAQRAKVLAVCNTNGSTIPRESDAVIYTHAGPEIGVASTKGFMTQLVACYLLGLYLAQVRGTMYGDEIASVVRALEQMPAHVQRILDAADEVEALAAELAESKSVLFLGRHAGYPVALEGALKLKELAYIHAEGFAAGELKHGPIALVEDRLPVFCVVPPQGRDFLHDKMVSGIQEVRARGARTIVLAEEGDEEVAPYADNLIRLPKVPTLLQPMVAVVPLQLFACELASRMGHDVDQPRNLAKSVTVE